MIAQCFGTWTTTVELGAGGNADVFLAQDARGRQAALKVLRHHRLMPADRARFDRECAILGWLRHPGIVALLDHGETADRPWLAMQYVPGRSAADIQAQRPEVFTPANVVATVSDVAAALDYAHDRGVLHRDIKPSNILITVGPDGAFTPAVLSDFGLAITTDFLEVTATDATPGSIGYTAPERLRGLPPVAGSDQYSLACTAFALLTGRSPFAAESVAATVHRQLSAQPPALSSLTPSVPSTVDAVLRRALAANPADRYPSCTAFANALADGFDIARSTAEGAAQMVDHRPERALYEDTIPPASPAPQRRARLSQPVTIGIAGAAVIAAVIAAVVVLGGGGSEPATRQETLTQAAEELCASLPRAAQDLADTGRVGLRHIQDLHAVSGLGYVEAGCSMTADVTSTDTPDRQTVSIGYSAGRPPDAALHTPRDARDGMPAAVFYYLENWQLDGRPMCLWGYRTEIGYLNVQSPSGEWGCGGLQYSLDALRDMKIASPARS